MVTLSDSIPQVWLDQYNQGAKMSNSVELTIDGETATYVREDSVAAVVPSEIQIVVVEGRWNFVGNVLHNEDGSLVISNAKIIRYWGTTKGLGELAKSGPTSKTVLDPVGVTRIPAHSVILCIDTSHKSW